MTRPTDLSEVRIINTVDQLRAAVSAGVIPREQAVAVAYHPAWPRSCRPARSAVFSPLFATDPNAHWSDAGCRVFLALAYRAAKGYGRKK